MSCHSTDNRNLNDPAYGQLYLAKKQRGRKETILHSIELSALQTARFSALPTQGQVFRLRDTPCLEPSRSAINSLTRRDSMVGLDGRRKHELEQDVESPTLGTQQCTQLYGTYTPLIRSIQQNTSCAR
jgi:hypothetical protein